jgi:hydrogenase-4 component F
MLSGALLPSALVVYYRMFTVLHSELLFHLTVIVGLLTLWVAAFLMIAQKKLKRLLAYSSMDVMGIATVGIGMSFVEPGIMRYVLILFTAHALGKSALFLSAGVLKRMGYRDIADVKNLASSPLTGFAVVVGALTVTGAPPFPMFFGEFGIVLSLSGHTLAFMALLGGILLSFLALNYHILRMLFDREQEKMHIGLKHSAVPLTAALSAILLSFLIYFSIRGWLI